MVRGPERHVMKNFAKALIGLVLVFVVHIPRLLYLLLLVSYTAVFANRPTLTADPAEHLKRARRILRRGKLSELLYATLELRFALERMAQRDLLFAEMASNRMLKEHDPVKKVASLHRLAPDAAFFHEIYLVNKTTGERIKWAEYKPLDKKRLAAIQGRLGDLLHPKEGLLLGSPDDPWYVETVRFLHDSLEYLSGISKDNAPFFAHDRLDQFEMVKVE
jgi:hypothetical protein